MWDLFFEASTERQIGFGIGPIPFSALDRLGRRAGLEGEEFERVRRLVRAMDAVFLDHAERQRREKGQAWQRKT